MGIVELLLLAVGLSMDAFAVSICKGLANRQISWREMALAGLWFGGFQALMPALGWLLGSSFQQLITAFDHWIAFGLLSFIGGKMVHDAFSGEEEADPSFRPRIMLVLAIATSIDAMAVGVTFAFLHVDLPLALGLIGLTTFCFSAAGVRIGNAFGSRYQHKAELAGGIILIFIGLKILLEHLGLFG